jgi:hypothetical protein
MLKLTLYGAGDEVKRELSRSIIPWGILERAIDIQESLSDLAIGEDGQPIVSDAQRFRVQIQELTDFVIFIFDDTVTSEELKRGASAQDMIALYRQIFTMVAKFKNPTKALTPAQNLQVVTQGKSKSRKR